MQAEARFSSTAERGSGGLGQHIAPCYSQSLQAIRPVGDRWMSSEGLSCRDQIECGTKHAGSSSARLHKSQDMAVLTDRSTSSKERTPLARACTRPMPPTEWFRLSLR